MLYLRVIWYGKERAMGKEEAKKMLGRLREGDDLRRKTDFYEHYLYLLRLEVKNGGFSLASIGTSEKELEEFLIEGSKAVARDWLDRLRRGTALYELAPNRLRREVKNGGLSFADIGTSEEELDELRIRGCRIAAQELLSRLRRGANYKFFLDRLRREIKNGGFSLADIGTSEEELEEIRLKGAHH